MKTDIRTCKLIFFSITLIIFALIVIIPNEINLKKTQMEKEIIVKKQLDISYIQNHAPITILGDSQFTSENGVISGNGSSPNPYLIENLIIDGNNVSSCIYIFYTSAYFIIKNCTFYNSTENNSGGGIKLEQVKNGNIYNNTITYNNGNGISLIYSTVNNTIYNNTITRNRKFGIFCYFDSDDNKILTNKFSNNFYEGIGGYLSNNVTVKRNIFRDNRGGLYLENDCINWTLYNNYFLLNLQECATDHSTNSIWHNGSSGNYWYDYVGDDNNGDGIGETPYQISGDSFSVDPFPIVFPDFDNDGLDNLIEELYYGTNKTKWDTDDDRYSDKVEVDYGTDPLDSGDFPDNAFAPQLSNGGIDESWGYEHINFTFFINYYDYDNNTPNFVEIIIDGKAFSMKKVNVSDNNYIDGCMYNF
ncbi:MAG: NosD domain-containing protein, partial [Candidatus Thorarchaeota archaeon]